MMGWLARLLHLDQRQPYDNEADATLKEVTVNLRELEHSQNKLKRAFEDTGFFLGDALIIQRQSHEPN